MNKDKTEDIRIKMRIPIPNVLSTLPHLHAMRQHKLSRMDQSQVERQKLRGWGREQGELRKSLRKKPEK